MDGNVPYFWTSGRLCDFTAVTDPISSPRTSTAGSGPPPSPPCRPPTPAAPSTTGHTQEAWGCLSQTTGRRLSSTETRSPAWPSSTTTTETASSGTTWPAHTRSPSSARTWTATSPTPGSTSLKSEYLETSHYSHGCLGRSQSRKTIYLWDLG